VVFEWGVLRVSEAALLRIIIWGIVIRVCVRICMHVVIRPL
jgi:hypothetical protein